VIKERQAEKTNCQKKKIRYSARFEFLGQRRAIGRSFTQTPQPLTSTPQNVTPQWARAHSPNLTPLNGKAPLLKKIPPRIPPPPTHPPTHPHPPQCLKGNSY